MSSSSGPKVVKDSILVDLDAANFKATPLNSMTNVINPFTIGYNVYNNPGFSTTLTRTRELFRGAPVYKATFTPQDSGRIARLGSTEGFGFLHSMGIPLLANTPYMASIYFRTNYPVNESGFNNTYSNIGGWGNSSTSTTRYREGKWLRMYTRYFNSITINGTAYSARGTSSNLTINVNTTAQTDILITCTFNSNGTLSCVGPLNTTSYTLLQAGEMVGVYSMSPTIISTTVAGMSTGTSPVINHGLDTTNWTKLSTTNTILRSGFPRAYYISIRVPSTSGANQSIVFRPNPTTFNTGLTDSKYWKITFNTSRLAVGDVIETFWAAPMLEQTDRLFPSPYLIGTKNQRFFTNTTWPDLSGNNNNGTLTNGPLYNSDNNGYFLFDGTNDYLTTPALFNSEPINYWTTSFWIYPSSGGWLISPNSGGIDHRVSYDSTNRRINFTVIPIQDSTSTTLSSTVNSIPLNTWTNVVISLNNLDMKIYINGNLNASMTATAGHDEVWAGTWRWCQRGNGTFPMQTRLANIKIYNDILTPAEIKQNFESFRKRFRI